MPMRCLTFLLLLLLVGLRGEGPVGAQAGGAAPVDVTKLGPQIGEQAPDFTATDQNGQSRTLTSLMGPNGAMLVFFRSADW